MPSPQPVLALAVDGRHLSITVQSPSTFPAVSGSMIRVDQELMRVIEVFGSTMTVMRGIEGTRVEHHVVGSAISVERPWTPKLWPTRFERDPVI